MLSLKNWPTVFFKKFQVPPRRSDHFSSYFKTCQSVFSKKFLVLPRKLDHGFPSHFKNLAVCIFPNCFKFFQEGYAIHNNYNWQPTWHRSQHSPAAHWDSLVSLQVIGSQQGFWAWHSSMVPQSHSSPSSRRPFPHVRVSICW